MAGDLVHWLTAGPLERQHNRELEAIGRAVEVAETWVGGINRVTQRAALETMRTQMLKQQAERIAPDGSELYAMIAFVGAVESARVIEDLNRRRRGR